MSWDQLTDVLWNIFGTAPTAAAAPSAAPAEASTRSPDIAAMADRDATLDGRTVAAIGLALSLEAEQKAAAARRRSAAAHPSAWGLSGRLANLR